MRRSDLIRTACKRPLCLHEAAHLCDVSEATLVRWSDAELISYSLDRYGRRSYTVADLRPFVDELRKEPAA